MFLRENRVCVFGTITGKSSRLEIAVIDVQDRRNPKILKEYVMSGKYFNGRMAPDGYIYLLTTAGLNAFNIPTFTIDGNTSQLPL